MFVLTLLNFQMYSTNILIYLCMRACMYAHVCIMYILMLLYIYNINILIYYLLYKIYIYISFN